MKRIFLLLSLLAMVSHHALADSKQTVTVNGTVTGKSATRITFAGDNITLSYSDGTSQTTDMAGATIAFDHVATFKDNDFDNLSTIQTFGGQTLDAEVTRTLTAGQWTAITLPFDLTANDIQTTFGEGTRVAVLESATATAVNFVTIDKMTAGMPYIICPAQSVSSFFVKAVTIGTMGSGSSIVGEAFTMQGTIDAQAAEGSAFLFGEGNTFKPLSGNAPALSAFMLKTGDESTLKGDVNHDGFVTVVDVMLIVNYILNGAKDFDTVAGDFNGDGMVNVTDVMSVVSAVLNNATPIEPITITIDGEESGITFQS